jgi:hypothetical protein
MLAIAIVACGILALLFWLGIRAGIRIVVRRAVKEIIEGANQVYDFIGDENAWRGIKKILRQGIFRRLSLTGDYLVTEFRANELGESWLRFVCIRGGKMHRSLMSHRPKMLRSR